MRPKELTSIFANISSIPGIGPKLQKLFTNIVGNKLVGFLWHVPYNIIKREHCENLLNAKINSLIILKVNVIKHKPSVFKRQPYRVNCICGDTPIDIIYFFAKHPYIKNILPAGEERFVSGKLEYYKNNYQITHPSHIINIEDINKLKKIEPVYGLTAGITQRIYSKANEYVLNKIPFLDEWLDKKTLSKFSFESWKDSLLKIHNPKSITDLIKNNIYRKRLAYDELLAHQLAIAIVRKLNQKKRGIKFIDNSILLKNFINNLPFKLTNSQLNAWNEIFNDLKTHNQMIRLLQGDVGSGKTILAILSIIHAVDSKYQVAMMAPTNILAQQHYRNIKNFLSPLDIEITILTSRDKRKSRLEKLELIQNGKVKVIVGTHSLIQDDVKYNSIGLVIIDEQHRFGVFQRMAFTNKGKKPSILAMSATPIPRTLSLAVYGDMDQSKITEKPLGRLPIITKSLPITKENSLINRLLNKLNQNEKAYWVCPLIEESEELDLQAATERYKILEKKFKGKVLLLHGKLKEEDKEDIMKKFQEEDYRILVTTTVIEVGIDIKDATTLIVEHAERFGLAQLHQLRGRVGRGTLQSTCILLYSENLGKNAKQRIMKMKETNDGFEIAEKDLEIRGAGEVLGKKQSGLPSFLIADLSFDEDLLNDVRIKVNEITKNDPKLMKSENIKLRHLLYLFERDIAIKTLLAG